MFAYEVAQAINLDEAERRLLAGAERQTIKQKRRAPASFEYRPAPLRVTRGGELQTVAGYRTTPGVEMVLYDFGAVSVSYTIPLAGTLADLPALAEALWGNERLLKDSRQHVAALMGLLGDAAARPHVADFVEDYSIFHVEAFTAPCDAAMLWTSQAQTVAQVLRAAPHSLSQQEIADATAMRLSFGPNDATIIDTDAAILFDPEGEDVRDLIEFANTQLLEMRFLDRELDDVLEGAYETLLGRRWQRWRLAPVGPDLRSLARLQLDAAILFEQVTNALKLVGDQFLARVYSLASRRFHLAEWDTSISRKLQTIDGIYAKMTDRAASRRMEMLEWIIIILIVVEIGLSVITLVP
ncbi:MAG: hypothetical protein AUI89_03855 [Gemmatimonadetes bacterium 13_1_40CM_3_65_8]|nr:MAG: hypothetical protein AUI89_03855 [Gemmatimonadetes bacterium 13_1_40CM_3_65_8]